MIQESLLNPPCSTGMSHDVATDRLLLIALDSRSIVDRGNHLICDHNCNTEL